MELPKVFPKIFLHELAKSEVKDMVRLDIQAASPSNSRLIAIAENLLLTRLRDYGSR